MNPPSIFSTIGVIGTGTMGQGIAQLAAQSGAQVLLWDAKAGAASQAIAKIQAQWTMQQDLGLLDTTQLRAWCQRLQLVHALEDLAPCLLVVEAIAEHLPAKHKLFAALESIVSPQCVLTSNTSSLSVSAIAAGLRQPQRVAGLHFFNPPPVMKVVEVVRAHSTRTEVLTSLNHWVRSCGHTPVMAQDTPGFIVNHAGRGLTGEALRIVGENVSDFATVDCILREQAGFKIGPFELLDLIGLDVSHAVMESMYRQYYDEPRYRPSALAAQRVAAGLYGRKTGHGFYRYVDGRIQRPPEPAVPQVAVIPPVWVSALALRRPELLQLLQRLDAQIESGPVPSPHALILVAPNGLDISTAATPENLDPARTIGIDLLLADISTRRRVLATTPATTLDMRNAAHALFTRDGKPVSVVRDSGGFVSQRVLAQIVNIGSDICQQSICLPADLDRAVTLALGYPHGPLAWGDAIGPSTLLQTLHNLHAVYGEPRYRPSPWLRRRAELGLSLAHTEH